MNWQPLFAERSAHMRRSTVRELLKLLSQPGMISFAGGIPAPELFPIEDTARAAAKVLQNSGEEALQYGQTEGIPALRDWIASRYSRPTCQVRRENVMIVTGSQQALDLIGKVFINPGDRLLVESPTYLAALSAWRPWRPQFVAVPSDSEGVVTSDIGPLSDLGAKLMYLVPNFQNPQGTTLSLARRKELLRALDERTVLVEDNPYGELRYDGEPLPDLLELSARSGPGGQLQSCVIHLGTFSKVLAPGFRVGWVVAPEEVIDKLVRAKQAADLHTSTMCQHLVLELIRSGVLNRQIPRLREAYRSRRDAMLSALAAHLPAETKWTRPAGGMFLLVTLPKGTDAAALLARALKRNVAFVPGDDFYPDGSGQNTLRLNFSNANPQQIEEGVKRLAEALGEESHGSGSRADGETVSFSEKRSAELLSATAE
jgi:2-aminoadipate transaminase